MKVLSPAQIEEMIGLYQKGYSSPVLGQKFGVSASAICGLLKRRGIKRRDASAAARRYQLNEHFFDYINSEVKAYWLGFLMADACIYRNEIILQLQAKDSEHVRKFAAAIETNKPVRIIPNGKNMAALIEVRSAIMVEALKKQGITARKSFTAIPPSLPNPLMKHFWRGMIDGDGSITHSGHRPHLKLFGSYATCKAFAEWALLQLERQVNVHKHKTIYDVVIGCKPAILLLDRLYTNAKIYLERKYARAMTILELGFYREAA